MITPNDILEALKKQVQGRFPTEEVYLDLCPNGFQRPCNLLQLVSCQGHVGYGCDIVEMRLTVTLTTFVAVDEYHHSHLEELHRRQMILLGLFLPGYIRVGKRAVKVPGDGPDDRIDLGGGWDYDTVTVPLVYTLDRSDLEQIEQLPVIEQLHLKEETNDV